MSRGASYCLPCPSCGWERAYTTDTRPRKGYIRRRRQCGRCAARFTTHEVLHEGGPKRHTLGPAAPAVRAEMEAALDRLGMT